MGRNFGKVIIATCLTVVSLGAHAATAQDLTLEQCIDLALKTNGSSQYGVPQARAGEHRSGQGVWTAWGSLLPSLSFSENYSHSKYPPDSILNPLTGEYIPSPSTTSRWSAGFNLGQTLFDGGANWYSVSQSYHNRAISRENLRGAQNALVLGVKENYFGLLKSQELVSVQEAAVRRAEQFHKTIESKYELGSASLSEVLKAKVELGTAQLELLRRQNDVRTGQAGLNTILNRRVDDPIEVAEVTAEGPQTPTYEEALDAARKESPDLGGARANLGWSKDELGIARATLFPRLGWSATRSFASTESGDLYNGSSGTWNTAIGLSYNIFSAFHQKTAISNARVSLKYARETEQQTEKAVEFAIKQAYLGVDLARESRNVADQTEASAQEDYNLAQEKYNLGAATILDLLNAQESLTRAQTDRVNALYDHYVTVARLQNAMGRR